MKSTFIKVMGVMGMTELASTITERRRKTRNSIYKYLYEADGLRSKQEIATALSLSLPTVHQNITELKEAGFVSKGGVQQSKGGRRAIGFAIAEDARYAVGVSITDNRFRFLAANLCLRERAYKKTQAFAMHEAEDVGEILARELECFLEENGLDRGRLLGVGIAIPGVLDQENRKILFAPTLQFRNTNLSGITGKIPYPCFVENDGTSGGYSEWFAQPTKGSMVYLSLEDGVGGAVLVGGAPYVGVNRRSGEFGHMCVEPGGLPCKCGKRGCLEAYCSASRISTDLGIALEDFFDGILLGNQGYAELWDDVLHHLAVGVNNIRMALDCDVVLGGFLAQFLEPFLQELRGLAAELNTFGPDAEYIRLCRNPRRAAVLGVALHFIGRFIDEI